MVSLACLARNPLQTGYSLPVPYANWMSTSKHSHFYEISIAKELQVIERSAPLQPWISFPPG